MVDVIQKAIQDVCVSALAAMALLVALHGVAVAARCFFARLRTSALAVLLSLAAVSSVILGSDKTNGLLQAVFPFNPQMQSIQHPQMQPVPFAPPSVPRLAAPSPRASADMPFRARNWNKRGAWDDSFRCAFPGEWVFPFGTGHLDRVEVCSQGRIQPRYGSTNVIAEVGVPLQIVNPLTSFGCGPTASNSYIFAWTNAVVGRVSRENVTNAETIDASIELFRNGDVAITTNGVIELRPRDLPFPRSGYGQDVEWVMANFTNATEILSVGYPQWVDAQVGEGLTNGLYKLTVTVPDDPPETTQLTVGDLSVAVTNAGEYVFLLEKGIDYQCGTVPFLTNVTYSAVDDVPQTRGGLRSLEPDGPMHEWTVDGGIYGIEPQTNAALGRVWWLPLFFGSPDVPHIGAGDGPFTFTANLVDFCATSAVAYSWSASDGITIHSPNAQSTEVSIDSMPSWACGDISVTATIGSNTLVSVLCGMTYGTNDVPQVSCSLGIQSVLFVNDTTNRMERVYPVYVSLVCPEPTNATVTVEYQGSDSAMFFDDEEMTIPLSMPLTFRTDSVGEGSESPSRTIYVSSTSVGGGTLTALFVLPGGETRGVAKAYRAIEPIRRLVCCDVDPLHGTVYNPSRLVSGRPARLKVGANGSFSPEEVRWSVVSGPGTVVRDEDPFGTADWTATVMATAASGEVVVEARFNEDEVQPRFVLPIVTQRSIPVAAYVVCASNGIKAATHADIGMKLQYANSIWRQSGVEFYLSSDPVTIPYPQCYDLPKYQTITNANGTVRAGRGRSQAVKDLLSFAPSNDCVRVFFVRRIIDSDAAAFAMPWCNAIVISQIGSMRVLPHELGHLIGLPDIYDYRNVQGSMVEMSGRRGPVARGCFDDWTRDWGDESGRGFYPADETASSIVRSLLMYGYDNARVASAVDVPSGSVWGFSRTANHPLSTGYVAVGANSTTIKED